MSSGSEAELGLYQLLSPEGILVGEPDPSISDELLLTFMRDIVKFRVFDEWMLKIHPLGKASRYAPCEGQEASMVGSIRSLRETDWVFPTYRELPLALVRGVPLVNLFNRMFSNSRDVLKGHEITLFGDRRYRIVVGAGGVGLMAPVAVGMAMAAKMNKSDEVFMLYLGDGATSKADFHEAVNWAGVFKPPVIFLCQNNQLAISLPFHRQTASPTIAIKSRAYGIRGLRVDGNDILAVYTACRRVVEEVRSGAGPYLIEAVTYRFGPHTTADDPSRYRTEEEVSRWRKLDPLERFRKYVIKKGLWSLEEERKFTENFKTEIIHATEEAEATPPLNPRAIFEDVYNALPWHLEEQLREQT